MPLTPGFKIALVLCCSFAPLARGATFYSIVDLCPSDDCDLRLLNDVGGAAGSNPYDPYPRVYLPGTGIITVRDVDSVFGLNNSGDIVGGSNHLEAYVAAPPYTELLNLNTVFNWPYGVATGINNYGDIIGGGYHSGVNRGLIPSSLFPDLTVTSLIEINDRRQITGTYIDQQNAMHNFLYTPGAGVAELADYPGKLSNTGRVLSAEYDAGRSYLLTSGNKTYLLGGYYRDSMNDSDEIVGTDLISCHVAYYFAGSGVVDIQVPRPLAASVHSTRAVGRVANSDVRRQKVDDAELYPGFSDLRRGEWCSGPWCLQRIK